MSISASKLLRVGGPALTGIGGVIATSSLVSKSAEEKPEERFKTAALKDDEPSIKEWKDRNESDQEGKGDEEPGSSSGDTEPSSDKAGEQGKSDSEATESSDSQGEEASAKGEGGSSGDDSPSEDSSDEGNTGGNETSEGQGIISDGSEDAHNNHAAGTAFGNMDRAMTQQELTQVQLTMDSLKDLKNQLSQIPGIDFS